MEWVVDREPRIALETVYRHLAGPEPRDRGLSSVFPPFVSWEIAQLERDTERRVVRQRLRPLVGRMVRAHFGDGDLGTWGRPREKHRAMLRVNSVPENVSERFRH